MDGGVDGGCAPVAPPEEELEGLALGVVGAVGPAAGCTPCGTATAGGGIAAERDGAFLR